MPIDTEGRGRNRIGPALFRPGLRPIEEGHVGTGIADLIGVEKMIGAHVILIDRFLHQTKAQHARVEIEVAADFRRYGADMMDTVEVHLRLLAYSFMLNCFVLNSIAVYNRDVKLKRVRTV